MSTTASPFVGRPTSGEAGTREIPSADAHEARCVALIDLGTHMESFQGGPEKAVRKVFLVWELDERQSASTYNHVIGQEYTLSFHEKAGLRQVYEAVVLGGGRAGEGEIDYGRLLGAAAMVTVAHQPSGDRTFAKVAKNGVGVVPKARRDKVFTPLRKPFSWAVGGDLGALPDWLPWYYGAPLAEKIKLCREMGGRQGHAGNGDGEGDVPAAGDDDATPF